MTVDFTNQNYWECVRDLAEQHASGVQGFDVISAVDNTKWVAYTLGNIRVLEYTKSENAAVDEMGSDALEGHDSVSDALQCFALFAMAEDVRVLSKEIKEERKREGQVGKPVAIADSVAAELAAIRAERDALLRQQQREDEGNFFSQEATT
jgi:hypothetical protein